MQVQTFQVLRARTRPARVPLRGIVRAVRHHRAVRAQRPFTFRGIRLRCGKNGGVFFFFHRKRVRSRRAARRQHRLGFFAVALRRAAVSEVVGDGVPEVLQVRADLVRATSQGRARHERRASRDRRRRKRYPRRRRAVFFSRRLFERIDARVRGGDGDERERGSRVLRAGSVMRFL